MKTKKAAMFLTGVLFFATGCQVPLPQEQHQEISKQPNEAVKKTSLYLVAQTFSDYSVVVENNPEQASLLEQELAIDEGQLCFNGADSSFGNQFERNVFLLKKDQTEPVISFSNLSKEFLSIRSGCLVILSVDGNKAWLMKKTGDGFGSLKEFFSMDLASHKISAFYSERVLSGELIQEVDANVLRYTAWQYKGSLFYQVQYKDESFSHIMKVSVKEDHDPKALPVFNQAQKIVYRADDEALVHIEDQTKIEEGLLFTVGSESVFLSWN